LALISNYLFFYLGKKNHLKSAQLRASLPQLISEIDAIYAWAATNAA
jgi:hypothetical protein